MKKVSFNCNDETVALFVEIMCKIGLIANRGRNAKIRIGGSEYKILGKGNVTDVITDFAIDDKPYSSLTPSECRDFTIKREALMSTSKHSTPTVSNTQTAPTFIGPDGVTGDNDNTTPSQPLTSSVLSTDEMGSIRSIINGKILRSEKFTAFDITKELRNQGKSAKHYAVKEFVHSLYLNGEMGSYDRDLNSNIGNPPPFEYHP